MLQSIPALFSQHSDKKIPFTCLLAQEGARMNLEELRARAAADLTGEEKQFLQDRVTDLDDTVIQTLGLEAGDAGDAGDDTDVVTVPWL